MYPRETTLRADRLSVPQLPVRADIKMPANLMTDSVLGVVRQFLPASAPRGSPKHLGFAELCQLSSNARFRTKQLSSSAGVCTKQGTCAAAHKRQISELDRAPSAALSAAKRTACCKAAEKDSLGHSRSSPCKANCAALDSGQLIFVTNLLTSLASLPMLRTNASSMSTIKSESTSCWSFVLA